MTEEQIQAHLSALIARWENEVVEFKEAGDGFSTSDIGKYFSALSNEANLAGISSAWLVFGVQNRTRSVVGTTYRPEHDRLQALKMQVANDTDPSTTFRNLYEVSHDGKRVLLFEIPAAPRGVPIGWKGHYYSRAGESLVPLSIAKQDEIRNQTVASDWTAGIVPEAGEGDLDEEAVDRAKQAFAQKYANRIEPGEVQAWPTLTFTDRARLTVDGSVTRAALLLLGRAESAWRLSPHPGQLTWKLVGQEQAYEHFGPPFLLTTSRLFQRIRNVQIRLLPDDQLLPEEVSKYDQSTVLEALHNCIAHQDYSRNGRVVVTETPDRLIFENEGDFFEGEPADYIGGMGTPRRYRNPLLVQAMVELNMIDTMGYGIHRMTDRSAKRYLPLPDYDLSRDEVVGVTVYGGVVDSAYTRLLMQRTDLPLRDVLALDRVQKNLPIPVEVATNLRRAGLVEGRRPHLHVSAQVAAAADQRADYIRTRAQADTHYAKLVKDFLAEYGSASRQDLDQLLLPTLSDALTPDQKKNKVHNLLAKLRRSGTIENTGPRARPVWRLSNKDPK